MENKTKGSTVVALICAIWFALTGYFWAYFANVIISFPFGLIAFLLWRRTWKIDKSNKLNKAVLIVLLIGVTISLGTLLAFALWG